MAAPETGSLILLHFHSNLEILERITEINNELFYLTNKFTFHMHQNKAILDLFNTREETLTYKGIEVGLEYTYAQIATTVTNVWIQLANVNSLDWFFDAQEDEVNDATEP